MTQANKKCNYEKSHLICSISIIELYNNNVNHNFVMLWDINVLPF